MADIAPFVKTRAELLKKQFKETLACASKQNDIRSTERWA
jgi:hypothetical protein